MYIDKEYCSGVYLYGKSCVLHSLCYLIPSFSVFFRHIRGSTINVTKKDSSNEIRLSDSESLVTDETDISKVPLVKTENEPK